MPFDGANTSLCNEDNTTAISILRCSGDRVKTLRFKITCEYDWALDGTDLQRDTVALTAGDLNECL